MLDRISSKIVGKTSKIKAKALNFASSTPIFQKAQQVDVFIKKAADEKFTTIIDKAFELVQSMKINSAQKVFTPVEFHPAKTLEEALDYSKQLGIKSLELGKNQTLEVVNYLNEGFTIFKNAHLGLAQVPARVYYLPNGEENLMSAVTFNRTFKVNENVFGIDVIDSQIKKNLDRILDYFCDDLPDGIEIPPYYSTLDEIDYLKKMIDSYRLNPRGFDYGKKVELFTMLQDFNYNMTEVFVNPKEFSKRLFANSSVLANCSPDEKQKCLNNILSACSRNKSIVALTRALGQHKDSFYLQTKNKKFSFMLHEMGHLQDYFFDRAPAKGKFESEDLYPEELIKWLSDDEKQNIAFCVSNYATSGPGEFIAETYSKLLTGENVPQKAIELYKQMHGPFIPNII